MCLSRISRRRAITHSVGMQHTAHLACAFPDSALGVADRMSDMARSQGLAAWTRPRGPGEWEIRFEGEEKSLRQFATRLGFTEVDSAIYYSETGVV
jgi:hypothetical protein